MVLTDAGARTFEQAMHLQTPWANDLADGLSVTDMETTLRVMAALARKLESDGESAQASTFPPV